MFLKSCFSDCFEKKTNPTFITRVNSVKFLISLFPAGVSFLPGSAVNSRYNPRSAKKPLKQTEATGLQIQPVWAGTKKAQKLWYKILPDPPQGGLGVSGQCQTQHPPFTEWIRDVLGRDGGFGVLTPLGTYLVPCGNTDRSPPRDFWSWRGAGTRSSWSWRGDGTVHEMEPQTSLKLHRLELKETGAEKPEQRRTGAQTQLEPPTSLTWNKWGTDTNWINRATQQISRGTHQTNRGTRRTNDGTSPSWCRMQQKLFLSVRTPIKQFIWVTSAFMRSFSHGMGGYNKPASPRHSTNASRWTVNSNRTHSSSLRRIWSSFPVLYLHPYAQNWTYTVFLCCVSFSLRNNPKLRKHQKLKHYAVLVTANIQILLQTALLATPAEIQK